ncbi:uncharacterized protein LOC106150709 [Lingula anatina]|uniref:Uncharacterized protein LOC106150709 n=1 Tax=Lingula anatina TaxID=7574 RepID=A0A1S3GZ25_LINAN|nr:uncharacterized protein LOC106150709 [Lingula anatina]|eukprot:XP_013379125.2 uncharacterized protein LOC106150709 [Lingula anatina]
MPGVPGITERPRSVKSGKPLPQAHTVQHRSDLLMAEQVQTVRECQSALEKALAEFEALKSPSETELEFHKTVIEEMKRKAEEAVMVLQVANKLNTELAYARVVLHKTLDNGGDPNTIRKRITWMEDKMEALCWKKSPRPHSRNQVSPRKEFPSSFPSTQEQRNREHTSVGRNDAGYVTDYSTANTMEPRSMSDTDVPAHLPTSQRHREETLDSMDQNRSTKAVRHKLPAKKEVGRKTKLIEEHSGGQVPPEQVLSVEKLKPSLNIRREQTEPLSRPRPEMTQSSLYPASAHTKTADRQMSFLSSELSEGHLHTAEQMDREEVSSGQKSQHQEPKFTVDSRKRFKEEDPKESEREEFDEADTRSVDEGGDRTPVTPVQVFMTETQRTQLASRGTQGSRVTIQSPSREGGDTNGEQSFAQDSDDLAGAYWESEHHRFDFGDYSSVLCEMDPLSYHQLGLAVPGTYINEIVESDITVPWRPKNAAELLDIHEIALNKLSLRMHKMYEKVHDAAMLSVDPNFKKDIPVESTFLKNLDQFSSRGQTAESVKLPGTQASKNNSHSGGGDNETTVSLPPVKRNNEHISKERMGTTTSHRIVFYPNPVTPPPVLPITRTSKDKEYPRLPNAFNDIHTPREKAERIVNQGNLLEKTKFSLYRAKPKSKTVSSQNDTKGLMHQLTLKEVQRKGATTPASSRSVSFKAMAKLASKMGGGDDIELPQSRSTCNMSRRRSRQGGPSQDVSMPEPVETGGQEEQEEEGTWKKIKPKSGPLKHSGIKWERVKDIVHNNLTASHPDERKDAIQVSFDIILIHRIHVIEHTGCWEEDVVKMIVKFLVSGNQETRKDLIRAMINGRNVQFVNKKMEVFPILVEVLSHFCKNPDPCDPVAFDASLCLGKLCVKEEAARTRLRKTLFETKDTHIKNQALDILVRQLHEKDWAIVKAVLMQLRHSPNWRHRAEAAKLIAFLGPKNVCKESEVEKVFALLESRLWDDPVKSVRLEITKALQALGMYQRVCDRAMKHLDSTDEDIRSQAVISLGVLGKKDEKTVRILLEMLELDSSEYVRLMIIRTFATMGITDKKIIRTLREREKTEGVLGRESTKALKLLGANPNVSATKVI